MTEYSPIEEKAIRTLESYYMRFKRPIVYIALENVEDAEFFWSMPEIERFDALWKEHMPIADIAGRLRRTEMAVFFLALDRIYQGKIQPRENWRIW